MRDIKFDIVARNIKFNEIWHQVFTLDEIWEGRIIDTWLRSSNCEILAKRRFTGLKDKNGVQIYEGDIVIVDNCRCVVVWVEDEACFRCKPEFEKNHFYVMSFNGAGSEEVIGNIYENPELVK